MADVNEVDILIAVSKGDIDEVNKTIRINDQVFPLDKVFEKESIIKETELV